MKGSDNTVVWSKIGIARFLTQISRDILVYGNGCIALFYNSTNQEEHRLVCNSPSGNGDGIGDIRGHKTVHVFAYTENCKNARVFVKNYPQFENIHIFDEGGYEGYSGLTFSETSLLVTLGGCPKFTLTVWNWRTRQKYSQTDTYVESSGHVLRCNWTKPVNLIHVCKNTKKAYLWDLYSCCKETVLGQHEIIIPQEMNVGLLTHAMWTTEGGLYITDSTGSVYMVDTEFTLERVLDVKYEGKCPPSIVWHQSGIAVSGPDNYIRHYVKQTGNWACDWTVTTETPLYQLSSLKNELLGVDEYGEIIRISEDRQISLFSIQNSSRLDDFCLIYPTGEYIVALKRMIVLHVFSVESGKLLSTYTLDNPATAINANHFFPYIALSCKEGFLQTISVYKPEKLSIMASLRLSHNPIQKIKFFEKGRIIVTAFTEKGEIFVIEGIPGTQMKVVAHVEVGRQVIDFILVASKTCYRLYVLPVTSKYLAGNTIIRYCITENGTTNVKNYFVEGNDLLYYQLIPTLRPNRDRIFYALCFNSRSIHELETKRADSNARVINEIKSGHLLRHFQFKLDEYFALSWGYDGFIIIRDYLFEEEIAVVNVHHRYDLGVKKAYVDPLGLYVISLGNDGIFCCTKINDRRIDENLKRNLTVLKQSDKFALMFKRPTMGLRAEARFADKTWAEINAMEIFEKEQAACKDERNQILKEFEAIKAIITDLVTKNLEGPDIEKIDLFEFYLDAFTFNQKKQDNREECKQTQIYLRALIDAQNLVSKHIIQTYHEPMGVKGKLIRGIFQRTVATIYILLPPNEAVRKKLAWVEEQRKIEEFLSVNCTFQPWLKISKEDLLARLKVRPKFANQDYNTMSSKAILEEGVSQLSIESQIALAGSVVQLYVDRNPWHYKQRQLVSFYQCDLQQTIAEQEVIKLKKHYNNVFNNMAELKVREMENIKEKHDRLRYIISEYNYFSDSKIHFEIEDPVWTQEEDPDLILKVTDDELTITPYVSPSEQAILDAKAAEDAKLRAALLADDFRERALYNMMSGVLELKWEDELKREVPLPKCMIEKIPSEYTEEDNRNIKEYEEKVQFLNSERERYKNILEVDFNKISVSLRDSIRKFNLKLRDTVEYKMQIDSGMNQENLRVNRARLGQSYRIKLFKKEEELKMTIEQNESIIEELQDTIKHLNNDVLSECKANVDSMLLKEKVLEKAFRKDMSDYSSPVQEVAARVYRRRPKQNFRHINVTSLLSELARCVINKETSLLLTPDCLDYLKALDYLDQYIGVPPAIDETNYQVIVKHRRIRIEFEIKLKAAQIQLQDGETTIAQCQRRLSMRKEKNAKLNAELKKTKEDYLYLLHNIQVQIVLRKGLVEIPLTGDILDDFKDAVLVPKREIEQINRLIKKAGDNKLKTINQNMAFRRKIMVTEWDHKKLRMTINDLIEQINDINAAKLLRDMQVYLKGKATGRKADVDSLEQELEVMGAVFETNMRDKKEKFTKLQKQIQSYQEHNKALDKTIQELNIDVCALKFNHDPELDIRENDALKARMDGIVRRSELVQIIQKNHSQILVLQTELELLRLRTYPTFKYQLINTEEKAS